MKANLFFWYGNSFLIKEKMDFWKKNFIEKNGDLNFDIIDCDEVQLNSILNSIQTLPFLGDKRLILLKNMPPLISGKKPKEEGKDKGDSEEDEDKDDKKLGKYEKIIEALNDVPDTNLIVFISYNPDKRTKIFKNLSSNCKSEFFDVNEKNFVTHVKDIIKRYNIKISENALKRLIELLLNDLFKIYSELNKLFLYKNFEEIGIEDVNLLIEDTSEINVFKIINLISTGKKKEALDELNNILRGESIVHVFNLIIRQIRLLLQVYDIKDKDTDFISKELNVLPFIASTLRSQVKNFSLDKLLLLHKNLYEIDKKFKTGKVKGDELLAFEIERGVILAG